MRDIQLATKLYYIKFKIVANAIINTTCLWEVFSISSNYCSSVWLRNIKDKYAKSTANNIKINKVKIKLFVFRNI